MKVELERPLGLEGIKDSLIAVAVGEAVSRQQGHPLHRLEPKIEVKVLDLIGVLKLDLVGVVVQSGIERGTSVDDSSWRSEGSVETNQ